MFSAYSWEKLPPLQGEKPSISDTWTSCVLRSPERQTAIAAAQKSPKVCLLAIVLAVLLLALLIALFFGKLRIAGYLLQPTLPCDGRDKECVMARETLNALPETCRKYIHSLSIRYDEPGLGGFTDTYGNVWLAGDVQPDEFRALFIHECGHITDFFALTGTPRGQTTPFTVRTMSTFADDLSLGFYTLSWVNPSTKKPAARNGDFVSMYAQLNVIEDFAETYTYYVLQRDAFEQRMKRNRTLKKKYEFMRKLFPTGLSLAHGESWNGNIPEVATGLHYEWQRGISARQ